MSADCQTTHLDIRCAALGRQLAHIRRMDEKALQNALTVLEEQGLYAMFLFVKARHDELAGEFHRHCVSFLREIFGEQIPRDALQTAECLACNLDDLLFACDLLRTALVYAWHYLRAGESQG